VIARSARQTSAPPVANQASGFVSLSQAHVCEKVIITRYTTYQGTMSKTQRPRTLRRTLHFSEDDLIFTAADGFDLIRIRGGTQTARVGWPSLPVVVKRYVLPAEATDVSVKVEKPTWTVLRGRFTLAPVQPVRPATGPRPSQNRKEPPGGRLGRLPLPPIPPGDPAYRNNEVRVEILPEVRKMPVVEFPSAELASVSHLGGRSVVAVRLHPLRYSPRRGRVEMLANLTLRIDYTLSRRPAKGPERSPAAAGEDLKRLMTLVDNPEDIRMRLGDPETFEDVPPICPDDPLLKLKGKGPYKLWPVVEDGLVFIPPDVIIHALAQDWPYIIITDDYEWAENGTKGAHVGNLITEFERLARWKTMKGVRARVVSTSDIMANAFGTHWQPGVTRDVQEAIRNFLKHAYQYWNTRWCLLGGDVNILPPRHILGNSDWFHIAKKDAADPAAGEMYYDASGPLIRYRAPYDFTTDDLFFAVDTGEVIRYRHDATTAQPGWYWTQSNYTTKSTTGTRYIVIRGPAALLTKTFTVPQYSNMIPSDFYYGSVDSPLYSLPGKHDWDNDNNGIYGWYDFGNPDGVDFAADISVGRAPVNDTASTTTFIDKVLTYELYRDVRADRPLCADFARKVMAVGAVWGTNWWDGSFERIRWGPLDGACQDKENVIDQFRTMGVEADQIQRVYEDIFFVPRIESNLIVLDCDHVDLMRARVNDGPHYMSVSGHGWWDGCSNFSSTNPDYVSVEAMTNWPNLAIYFVDSCLTNEFDLTHWTAYNRTGGAQAGDPSSVCLGKHVVRYGNGGAIGYVGYSRMGGVGATHEMQFWETLSLYGQDHLGKMLDRAREICKDSWAWQANIMTLMGDPELRVWTQSPKALTVSHASFIYGQDKLTVSVYYKEAPLTSVTVTVCQMPTGDPTDKVYFNLVEAAVGHYTFDTSGAVDGDVFITVTGKNYIPYVGQATKVGNPVSPWKYRTDGFIYDLASGSGTSLFAASGDKKLYALSPTSGLLRSSTLNGPVQDLETAPDGSVLAGVRKNVAGNLLLYNSSGTLLQSWNMPNEVYCVALDPAHATAYAGLRDQGVQALNTSTGAVRWTRTDVGNCLHLGIDSSGDVYACVTLPAPTLLKLTRTSGATLWSYAIGADWKFESRALLVEGSGVCYIGTRNRELHKVDASGTLAWKLTQSTGPNQLSTSVHSLIKSGARLYAGAGDGSVLAIAPDGTVEWRRDIGDRTDCMTLGSGALYLGSWHGVTALDTNGNPLWFREVTGGVLSMLRKGTRLFGGSRDGWVYEIDIPPTLVKFGDLVVKGDVLTYAGVLLSGGGTRDLPYKVLDKILRVKRKPIPGPGPDPGPLGLNR